MVIEQRKEGNKMTDLERNVLLNADADFIKLYQKVLQAEVEILMQKYHTFFGYNELAEFLTDNFRFCVTLTANDLIQKMETKG